MINISIAAELKNIIPNIKLGIITYQDTVIEESPKMLKGRLDFFQESINTDAETQNISDIEEIQEWRKVFKQVGTDPSKYRPSSESLYRRIYRGERIGFKHSGADTNNFFSLQYKLPMGIYDLDKIENAVLFTIGQGGDTYEALNERQMNLKNKLILKDNYSAFGSPIVDSKRTMVTKETKNVLQVIYFTPSLPEDNAQKMLHAIQKMFFQINSGEVTTKLVK